MKRAVLTGATGAIGTALVKNFIDHGIEVLVLLRGGSLRNDRIPEHPLVRREFCSLEHLSNFQCKEHYDVFYHFGWDGTFGAARQDTARQIQNIRYTLDAIDLAKRLGCHTFVGAGSQAEYGRVEGNLTPETPTFPENVYGIAKLCAGQMGRLKAQEVGILFNWVRILSVYGPNDGENSMISSAIAKMKMGEHVPFTRGEQIWDYLFSYDAAEAFRLIGERGSGTTYVLGSGNGRPLEEYIRILAKTLGTEHLVGLGELPYAEKQVMHLVADVSKLREDTGWTPSTDFEEGIRKTIGF